MQEEHDVNVPLSFIKIEKQMQNIMSTAPKTKLLSHSETALTLHSQSNNTQREDKIKMESTNQIIGDDESVSKKLPGKLMTPFRNQSHDKKVLSIKSQIQDFFKQEEKQMTNKHFVDYKFKLADHLFKPPQEQIKQTKQSVEKSLLAIKYELNKLKTSTQLMH